MTTTNCGAPGAHDTRDGDVPVVHGGDERLLRIRDVASVVGLSGSQIYALVQGGKFPRPVSLGPHCSRWVGSEVQTWLRMRIAAAPRLRVGSRDRSSRAS